MIEMSGIRKTYRMGEASIHALDGVDLTVAEGDYIAIVGPSGSGKSTLMNMVGLLDVPDEGTYSLDGEDVARQSDARLTALRNRNIGFIFQSFNLLASLSAVENVRLPLLYRGIKAKVADAAARRLLAEVGLEGRESHVPSQLSGGQQQRVAIARALVGSPRLILADEPTGALDSKTSTEIMDMLDRLHQEGQTIILITHNHELALRADRIIKMADGVIREEVRGAHEVDATR